MDILIDLLSDQQQYCGGFTEVPVNNLDGPSIVTANMIQMLSWRERKAAFIAQAEASVYEEVLLRILPLIGAEKVFGRLLGE